MQNLDSSEPIYAEAQQRNRRSSEDPNDPHAMVAFHNKQNLAQREQYYAAVQKGAQTPVRASNNLERIPGDDPSMLQIDWLRRRAMHKASSVHGAYQRRAHTKMYFTPHIIWIRHVITENINISVNGFSVQCNIGKLVYN